jgi:hypothetical protein
VVPRTDPYVQCYRIRLLPCVFCEKATTGVGVHQARMRDPASYEFDEAAPVQPMSLAVTSEAVTPAAEVLAVERMHSRAIAEDGVVIVVPTHNSLEPGADDIRRLMSPLQQRKRSMVNIRRRGGASRAKCKAGAAMPFGDAADECFRHDRSQRQRPI